jgi:hypothetical protein
MAYGRLVEVITGVITGGRYNRRYNGIGKRSSGFQIAFTDIENHSQ